MLTRVNNNMWRREQGGLYAPVRRRFPINGLVLYAPLWHPELSGSTFNAWNIADGGVYTCTPTGTTKFWTPQGWDLAGADEYIALATDIFSQADFAAGLTLEAWVNLGTVDDSHSYILTIEGRCTLAVAATTDLAWFNIYDDANKNLYADDFGALSLATWYHIVGTWDATDMSIYVNAVADATTLAAGILIIDNVNRASAIGSQFDGSLNTDGVIGEVRIYNRALSAGEVTHNYNSTKWRY